MNVEWTTLGINAVISLFISLIVFALGLRAGKERTERKDLREQYRKLLRYFTKIEEGFLKHTPPNWGIAWQREGDDVDYVSVKYLINNNNHFELNERFLDRLSKTELISLRLGTNCINQIFEMKEDIINCVEKYMNLEEDKRYTFLTLKSEHELKLDGTVRTIRIDVREFIFDSNIIERIHKKINKDNKYYLEITIPERSANTNALTLFIYPGAIEAIDLKVFMQDIFDTITGSIEYKKNKSEYLRILSRIRKDREKLKKKVKEPYSFWNTISNTFRDFKG